jgi:hypothetical protein
MNETKTRIYFAGDKIKHISGNTGEVVARLSNNDQYSVYYKGPWGLRQTSGKYLELVKRDPCITAENLPWDEDGKLAYVYGYWAKKCKLYVDVPPQKRQLFEDRYFSVHGIVPEPKVGLYHISNDPQKRAMEAEITFPAGMELPPDLADQQTAQIGKIARVSLFWRLIEDGFELAEKQDSERIKIHIAPNQEGYFNAGLKGEPWKLTSTLLK